MTRRASARSGVTSAAVFSSSTASRSATAMASASSSALAASIMVRVESAASACASKPAAAARCRHRSVAAAGRKTSDTSRSRPHGSTRFSTASRAMPMRASNACSAYWACPGAGAMPLPSCPAISRHESSSRSVSRPGSTTAPWASRAMVAINSAVAGIEPVEPAAITGPSVLRARRAASALISASRRLAGSMKPRSSRIAGQLLRASSRNFSVSCQY